MTLQADVEVPFVSHLGFEMVHFEGGVAEMRYEARPEHLNSHGITHGGASMALMDVAMARAARSVQKDMGVVTIEIKTTFMRPAKGMLTARGRVLHRTPALAFTEGSIFDAQGRLCAHATGTFKYVKRAGVAHDGTGSLPAITTD